MRSDWSLRHELRARPWFPVFTMVFFGVGLWAAIVDRNLTMGAIASMFVLFGALMAPPFKRRLSIYDEGLAFATLLGTYELRWTEVSKFRVREYEVFVRFFFMKIRRVVFEVTSPAARGFVARVLGLSEMTLPSNYRMRPDDLVASLNRWRRKGRILLNSQEKRTQRRR